MRGSKLYLSGIEIVFLEWVSHGVLRSKLYLSGIEITNDTISIIEVIVSKLYLSGIEIGVLASLRSLVPLQIVP